VHRQDIAQTPGFQWFESNVIAYNCDSNILTQLKTSYKPNKHSFLFFEAPACSCDSSQLVSPYTMRILDQMQVDTAHYKFYIMENETKDHPYSSVIKLKRLPSIFLMVDGNPVYSINDTLKINPSDRSIEKIILDALNMYP